MAFSLITHGNKPQTVFQELDRRAAIDHVLFGTDFPYLRRDLAVNARQPILQTSELNDLERRAVLGGNAARLFPRLYPTFKETSS